MALEQGQESETIKFEWGGANKDKLNAFVYALLYRDGWIDWAEWKEEDQNELFYGSELPYDFFYQLGHTGRGYEDLDIVELSVPTPDASGETRLQIADFTGQIAQILENYSERRFTEEDKDSPRRLNLEQGIRLLRLLANTATEREIVIRFSKPNEAGISFLESINVPKEASKSFSQDS